MIDRTKSIEIEKKSYLLTFERKLPTTDGLVFPQKWRGSLKIGAVGTACPTRT
jgi:hypothetical protein